MEGKHLKLYEHIVSPSGDCGYVSLCTSRSEAASLLLRNAYKSEIRELVAPEIFDLFTELPDPMKHEHDKAHPYQKLTAKHAKLDSEYRTLVSSMNDLIARPENNRWDAEKLRQHYQILSLSGEQQAALEKLDRLNSSFSTFIQERMEYCRQEQTFTEFVNLFIKPSVREYLAKYGDNNWLNYSRRPLNNEEE